MPDGAFRAASAVDRVMSPERCVITKRARANDSAGHSFGD